jgi:hypothetical protein
MMATAKANPTAIPYAPDAYAGAEQVAPKAPPPPVEEEEPQ